MASFPHFFATAQQHGAAVYHRSQGDSAKNELICLPNADHHDWATKRQKKRALLQFFLGIINAFAYITISMMPPAVYGLFGWPAGLSTGGETYI
jgi:hypothetical protein